MDETVFAVLGRIAGAVDDLRATKPNDRSELDRRFAISITEFEKALAVAREFLAES